MFEKAYPDDFQILVSRDKVNWTVARTIRGFKTTDTDKLKYESVGVCLGKARYVKVRCIKMAYHNAMCHKRYQSLWYSKLRESCQTFQ